MANELTFKQELTTVAQMADTSECRLRHMPMFNIQRELTEVKDLSEDAMVRFTLAASSTEPFSLGTVSLGKILIIRSDRDLLLTVTNTYGTFQFKQRKTATSVIHMEYSAITAMNLEGTDATGYYYVSGD